MRAPDPEGLIGGVFRDHDAFHRLVGESSEGVAELVGPTMFRFSADGVAYVPLHSAMPGPSFIWVGMPMDSVRATVFADSWRVAAHFASVLAALLMLLSISLGTAPDRRGTAHGPKASLQPGASPRRSCISR